MKKYLSQSNLIYFLKLNIKNKLKFILILIGIKKIITKLIYYSLYFFLKTKIFFLRGIIFDFYKELSDVIIYSNKYGEKFALFSNDKVISKEIFVKEEFDLKKIKKTLNYLNNKSKIKNLYDIGANIGSICIPAVKRNLVDTAFAVEPVKKNFQLLKVNIILNNLEDKIKTFNYALNSNDDQSLDMELSNDNSGDHRVRLQTLESNLYEEKNRKVEKVESKKFDTLFQNLNSQEDLVWIDTQGFEPIILSGAQNLIISKTPIVVEFWPYGLKRNNLWEQMRIMLEKFDYFSDLSETEINLKTTSKKNLDNLFFGWETEKKNKHALFTDLLLIKN